MRRWSEAAKGERSASRKLPSGNKRSGRAAASGARGGLSVVLGVDKTGPTVFSINRVEASPTNATVIHYDIIFNEPVNWALEMSQFLLSAYYLLGGAYAMQRHAHVRMDLFYSRLPARKRAVTDAITILCVIFFLGVLLYGGISSTGYALQYGQKNYSAWSPPLWPIKIAMTIGVFLMLLQCLSTFFRDVAEAIGKPIE